MVLDRIIELMREHQIRSRFVESAYQSPLSLLEGYLVIELDRDGRLTQNELTRLISADESAVVRALDRLREGGYLSHVTDRDDARRRLHSVTAKGRKFLDRHDEASRVFLMKHLTRHSLEEIAEIQRFHHVIADACDAAPVRLRASEHPFEEGLRRITRGLGFVGRSLFGSGHSSTVWQVLAEIAGRDGTTLKELQETLGVHVSTLSQILTRFERDGWVKRRVSADDARRRLLSVTAKGEKTLAHIRGSGTEILRRAFEPLEPGAVERFLQLFEKHLGMGARRVIRQELHFAECETEVERKRARGFLVFHLTRLRRYLDVPEVIIGRENRTFVLRSDEAIAAVCEMARTADSTSEAVNFAYAEQCEAQGILSEFLDAVRDALRSENPRMLVLLPKLS